ncbi:ATP/GTP-binding protein [Paralimibaculum aggregatum]|uniref:ATP/GTP-binding protein n=1 Tax=Paralimibaculum aggregatum TaxID=3036245 RepID=A0ABQ6LNC7_9RHOB|nr:ATP/GTP-binding protein [Limibaculum sp. NKW23]GMG84678.1 ATP/GTP-binding protein [Limibaculum sp. NKW23]
MSGAAALAALAARGKAGLGRALSEIEARPEAPDTTALLDAAYAAPRGIALGLTGPPGVGKSTLTDGLIRHWRGEGRSVGVIAVDPSSARSRGALLGDRTRITTDPEDEGVFLRSMAARDRLGGIAEITFPAMVLMRALFDRVIVETVGVGQSETAIAGLCDLVLLCAQPASGDALQFLKAGIMEVPDIVAVTKADLGPLAARTVADLKGALSVTAGRQGAAAPRVLAVSAQGGGGLAELAGAVDAAAVRPEAARRAAHAAQIAAWEETQVLHRFGRAGLAALVRRPGSPPEPAPFAAAARRSGRFDAALQHVLAEISAAPQQFP